jgi:hypothetical protein
MEEPLPKVKKPGAPSWATQPFDDFLAQTKRLSYLLHLCINGISVLRGVPRIIHALNVITEQEDENSHTKLDAAKKEAELAQREMDEDFPLLHAQFTILLWSSLESLIRLFIVRWLQNHKPAMEAKEIQKLQVKIGEYERLEGEERYFYIIDRLEQELSIPLANGVNRFENLLSPFGLSGPVDENIRRELFELNQVRNVLVHRSGIADRRFIESCPWLNLHVGDPVKINYHTSQRYFKSVQMYNLELLIRLGEYFGVDVSSNREDMKKEVLVLYGDKRVS